MGGVWRMIRWLSRAFVVPLLNVRVRGAGLVPRGGALILSNHQSFADPILVGVGLDRQVGYMARDSLFRVPGIAWVMRRCGVIAVRRDAATSLREPIRRLQTGRLVCLYPEGTRTPDGCVHDVKPGFVAIARRAGVPIVFCGIAGAFEAWPRTHVLPRTGRVRVVFGELMTAAEVAEWSAKGREAEFAAEAGRRLTTLATEAYDWRRPRA